MGLDGRITRLERDLGPSPEARVPTYAVIVEDLHTPVDSEELSEFLASLAPPGTLAVMHHLDNGRDPNGPRIFYGGPDWMEPLIQDGRIVDRGRQP